MTLADTWRKIGFKEAAFIVFLMLFLVGGAISDYSEEHCYASVEQANYGKAVDHCSTAILLNFRQSPFYSERGIAYEHLGEREAALEDYNRAIKLDSTQWYYYANRCFLWADFQRFEEAMRDCNKAIELDSNQSYVFSERAFVRFHIGDKPGAIEDLEMAISLDPTIESHYYALEIVQMADVGDWIPKGTQSPKRVYGGSE